MAMVSELLWRFCRDDIFRPSMREFERENVGCAEIGARHAWLVSTQVLLN